MSEPETCNRERGDDYEDTILNCACSGQPSGDDDDYAPEQDDQQRSAYGKRSRWSINGQISNQRKSRNQSPGQPFPSVVPMHTIQARTPGYSLPPHGLDPFEGVKCLRIRFDDAALPCGLGVSAYAIR